MAMDRLPYQVKEVGSWTDAKVVFESLRGAWIFRGQADTRYTLSTALERQILDKVRASYSPEQLLALEHTLTKRFMRGAAIYYTAGLVPTNTLSWWAEMQHYGMPTRLLDFTWSPYVASYFAMEDGQKDCDCAIWALRVEANQANMTSHQAQIADFIMAEFGDTIDPQVIYSGDFWDDATLVDAFINAAQRKQFRALIYVATNRMNQRMIGQQGVFVMPTCLDVSFMDCLTGPDETRSATVANLIKIVLPRRARWDVLTDLLRMNITRMSLFPGLEGFARTLAMHLEHVLAEGQMQIQTGEDA
jgi:FRG domain